MRVVGEGDPEKRKLKHIHPPAVQVTIDVDNGRNNSG